MSNGAYRSYRMRQELAVRGSLALDIRTPFTDADMKFHSSFREARDRTDAAPRFKVTIIPRDGQRRDFILCGSLESVERRALALYPQSYERLILVEPEKTAGPEVLDPRLSLSI